MSFASTIPKAASAPVSGTPGFEPDWSGRAGPAVAELLASVPATRDRGVALYNWWRAREWNGGFERCFPLIRSFNPPSRSYGFFDTAPLNEPTPVMGFVQELIFDFAGREPIQELAAQLREFVLHYFMRVTDYHAPRAFAGPIRAPEFDSAFSWCQRPDAKKLGFGYSQRLASIAGRAVVEFHGAAVHEIIDLREIGRSIDWLLAKVDLFDFNLQFHPFGQNGPELAIPLPEENYLLLTPEFIVDDSAPVDPSLAARYGLGYSLMRTPGPIGLVAYGPGKFEAGFKTIHFNLLRNGTIRVEMAFTVDRARRIFNVPMNPLAWGIAVANCCTFGSTTPMFERFLPLIADWVQKPGFDPLLLGIDMLNRITGGRAARDYCISREQLEMDFLIQHFMQHYQMIIGALSTWRQVHNWLDPASIPKWMRQGVISASRSQ